MRQFGATGDGVTNDTAAIQAAIRATREGWVLYFPKGTYVVCGTELDRLTLSNRRCLTFQGDGPCSVIQRARAPEQEYDFRRGNYRPSLEADLGLGILYAENCRDLSFQDITFDANGFVPALDLNVGIALPAGRMTDGSIFSLSLLELHDCTRVQFRRCRFVDASPRGPLPVVHPFTHEGSRLAIGFFGLQTSDVVVEGCTFRSHGIWLDDVDRARVSDNSLVSAQGHAIGLACHDGASVRDLTIRGNRIVEPQGVGIGLLLQARADASALDRISITKNAIHSPQFAPFGIIVGQPGTEQYHVPPILESTFRGIHLEGNYVFFSSGFVAPAVETTNGDYPEGRGIWVHSSADPGPDPVLDTGVFKFSSIRDNIVVGLDLDGSGIAIDANNLWGCVVSGNGVYSCHSGLAVGTSYRTHVYANRVENTEGGDYSLTESFGGNVFDSNAVLGSPHRAEWRGASAGSDTFLGGDVPP